MPISARRELCAHLQDQRVRGEAAPWSRPALGDARAVPRKLLPYRSHRRSSWPGDSLEVLLERADAAMYAAKRAGRNRVEIAAADAGPIA